MHLLIGGCGWLKTIANPNTQTHKHTNTMVRSWSLRFCHWSAVHYSQKRCATLDLWLFVMAYWWSTPLRRNRLPHNPFLCVCSSTETTLWQMWPPCRVFVNLYYAFCHVCRHRHSIRRKENKKQKTFDTDTFVVCSVRFSWWCTRRSQFCHSLLHTIFIMRCAKFDCDCRWWVKNLFSIPLLIPTQPSLSFLPWWWCDGVMVWWCDGVMLTGCRKGFSLVVLCTLLLRPITRTQHHQTVFDVHFDYWLTV